MSAPKYDVHHVDLDTMTITYVGRISHEELLKHPSGDVYVTLENGEVWHRSDADPVWRLHKDGKPKITITTPATKTAED